MLTSVMPIKFFLAQVHTYLTKNDYTYSIDDLCDIGLAACNIIQIYNFFVWSRETEFADFNGLIAEQPLTDPWEIYTNACVMKSLRMEFQTTVFFSVMIVFIWGRFILMLQLTRTFGPMLRIIIVMIGDVLKFLVIWSIELICFSTVSALLFGELDQYKVFFQVFIYTFGTGLGNYDYTVFAEAALGQTFGEIYVVFVVIINSIVLLNFIIAILADTYSKLSVQSLGIYYDGIISRIPIYEYDSRYGGLIIGTPPYNVFALFMVPYYLIVKD